MCKVAVIKKTSIPASSFGHRQPSNVFNYARWAVLFQADCPFHLWPNCVFFNQTKDTIQWYSKSDGHLFVVVCVRHYHLTMRNWSYQHNVINFSGYPVNTEYFAYFSCKNGNLNILLVQRTSLTWQESLIPVSGKPAHIMLSEIILEL